jgi:hypothetical protein
MRLKQDMVIEGDIFFSHLFSGTSRDIANFLFETEFDNVFYGIIIEGLNMWINNDAEELKNINNQYIIEV